MFDSEISRSDYSVLSLLAQQILVPLLSLVGTAIIVDVVATLADGVGVVVADRVVLVLVLGYLSPFVIGFALGWGAYVLVPATRSAGPWIWMLPTAFWIILLLSGLFVTHENVFDVLIYTPRPEGGLVIVLITLPTVACCCYAIGMRIAARRMLARAVHILPPPLPPGASGGATATSALR